MALKLVAPPPKSGWRGLNERKLMGSDVAETSSLDNVMVRNGAVEGRKGIAKWDGIVAAEPNFPVIALMQHYSITAAASTLLRMTPASVQKWNSADHRWDDITGTALSGTATTRPQWCNVGELNYISFTNEGLNRPRKYAGSGNTAEWGGTPPYCKSMEYYVGFLALGNISTNGTDWRPIDLILSDDPDNTWVECDDTSVFVSTMVLDETPGEIRALKVRGPILNAYKADGIVAIRFTGGQVRFQRNKVDFPLGILAPLSLQSLGDVGDIFLATDRNLYVINNAGKVEALPANVQRSLQEIMPASVAPYVRAMVDYSKDTYILGYQRDGENYLDGTLEWNYRSGEFTRKSYPIEINSMLGYKQSLDRDIVRLASSDIHTYQLESGTDDDGTAVNRYFDIDWSMLGMVGNKYVTGGEFTFEKARDCRVRISIAVDKSSKFQYPKWFDLRGRDPDSEQVRVAYDIPSPVFGTWFKFRVQMYHDGPDNIVKMLDFEPEIISTKNVSVDTPVQANVATA